MRGRLDGVIQSLPPADWAEAARSAARAELDEASITGPIEVEHILTNAVFLTDRDVVKVYPPALDAASVQVTYDAVAALAAAGAPVMAPYTLAKESDAGPLVRFMRGDTFDGSRAEIAVLLRRLHDHGRELLTEVSPVKALPRWTPLQRLDGQLQRYLDAGGDEQLAGRALDLRSALLDELARTRSVLGETTIHTDPSPSNVVYWEGQPLLIDCDGLSVGPAEYDLVSAARQADLGAMSESEYEAVSAAYGADVRSLPLYPVLLSIVELGSVGFDVWTLVQDREPVRRASALLSSLA